VQSVVAQNIGLVNGSKCRSYVNVSKMYVQQDEFIIAGGWEIRRRRGKDDTYRQAGGAGNSKGCADLQVASEAGVDVTLNGRHGVAA